MLVVGMTGSGRSTVVRELCDSLPGDACPLVVAHRHAKAFGLETRPFFVGEARGRAEEVYDFGSGCVCCAPDGDLARLLTGLIINAPTHNFSHVIIEACGTADPAPFLRLLMVDPAFVSLGKIVVWRRICMILLS